MGQYYVIINIDKRQYLDPHKFGDSLKLMEFACSAEGVLCGLAVLLVDGNGRGSGDLGSEEPVVGSWAGNRVVIAGAYGDPGKFLGDEERPDRNPNPDVNLYKVARDYYEDVSDSVIRAIVAAEGERSRLSKIDFTEEGWRTV